MKELWVLARRIELTFHEVDPEISAAFIQVQKICNNMTSIPSEESLRLIFENSFKFSSVLPQWSIRETWVQFNNPSESHNSLKMTLGLPLFLDVFVTVHNWYQSCQLWLCFQPLGVERRPMWRCFSSTIEGNSEFHCQDYKEEFVFPEVDMFQPFDASLLSVWILPRNSPEMSFSHSHKREVLDVYSLQVSPSIKLYIN